MSTSASCVWDDVPGFGNMEPMAPRPVNPLSREEIARRLDRLRRALNYPSDAAFARAMGMTAQQYNNIKQLERGLTPENAGQIAARTGATFDYLYRGLMGGLPHDLHDRLTALGD